MFEEEKHTSCTRLFSALVCIATLPPSPSHPPLQTPNLCRIIIIHHQRLGIWFCRGLKWEVTAISSIHDCKSCQVQVKTTKMFKTAVDHFKTQSSKDVFDRNMAETLLCWMFMSRNMRQQNFAQNCDSSELLLGMCRCQDTRKHHRVTPGYPSIHTLYNTYTGHWVYLKQIKPISNHPKKNLVYKFAPPGDPNFMVLY